MYNLISFSNATSHQRYSYYNGLILQRVLTIIIREGEKEREKANGSRQLQRNKRKNDTFWKSAPCQTSYTQNHQSLIDTVVMINKNDRENHPVRSTDKFVHRH